ncbi:hypothetical protein [Rhodococcus sp. AG1013]|uniref:hypothetical protein n=1 Tax=Rhodococcus sp. AG1013 TaxID=2183996 RepID=UPI0011C074EB|nr:hypothetical protein [Rhodococcus sp. AG1013]
MKTERELWDVFQAKLCSVVLLVPNKHTKIKEDRLARLVDLRIDTSDTSAYVADMRYVQDPVYLEHPGAAVVATLQYLDTGKKVYNANPSYLRDPETRQRLVESADALGAPRGPV